MGLEAARMKDGANRLRPRIDKSRVVLEGMTRSIDSSIWHIIQPDLGLERSTVVRLDLDLRRLLFHQITK